MKIDSKSAQAFSVFRAPSFGFGELFGAHSESRADEKTAHFYNPSSFLICMNFWFCGSSFMALIKVLSGLFFAPTNKLRFGQGCREHRHHCKACQNYNDDLSHPCRIQPLSQGAQPLVGITHKKMGAANIVVPFGKTILWRDSSEYLLITIWKSGFALFISPRL